MIAKEITANEEQLSRMPEYVNFGHVNYTVHSDPTEIHGEADDPIDVNDQVGGSFHTSRQIWVRTDGMSFEQVQNTLLHEVLHVCIHITGAQYALEQLRKSSNVEEAYVSVLTTPLHGVMIENPDLIDFLQR